MKPHPPAAHIKDWAEGHQMQYRTGHAEHWQDFEPGGCPIWYDGSEYRRKPTARGIQTKMTDEEISTLWGMPGIDRASILNAGIARAIADMQVTPVGDMQSATLSDILIKHRAARDMAIALAVGRKYEEGIRFSCQLCASDLEAIIAKVPK
jgi:hypothetical protein